MREIVEMAQSNMKMIAVRVSFGFLFSFQMRNEMMNVHN